MSWPDEGHLVEYPTPQDVFREALQEMLERAARSRCRFGDADSSVRVEVARKGRNLQIKLPYPYRVGLADVLMEQGVTVPEGWRIVRFRRKGLLLQGRITYLAPREDLDRVVVFLDNFFANTCPKGRGYAVLASVRP